MCATSCGNALLVVGMRLLSLQPMSMAERKPKNPQGKNILIEGANAALLDIDFGTYPYVTLVEHDCGRHRTGLGVPPSWVRCVVAVVKAYTTRVGGGPFPTELNDDDGKHLLDQGHEYGTTTGRPRRCGWLDVPLVKYSNCLNGYTSMNVTKLDVLTGLEESEDMCCVPAQRGRKDSASSASSSADCDTVSRVLPPGYFPTHFDELSRSSACNEEMDGWSEEIGACRSFDSLPKAAQHYLSRMRTHWCTLVVDRGRSRPRRHVPHGWLMRVCFWR